MGNNHRVFMFGLFFLYLVGMTAIMIWQGIGLAPDRYAMVLLLGSLVVKRTRSFLLDWIPFLFILITYDFLRGFADNLGPRVHYQELIDMDLFLFGFIPTIELQKLLFDPNHLRWYDYLATILYFPHFALPLSFGFLAWMYNKSLFRQFVTAILLLSYAGFLTYMAYPAAPPWLAQQKGYITGIHKIMNVTSRQFSGTIDLPTIYTKFNPNPVAAIPSLHAAYPTLIFLFAWQLFRKKALLMLPYVFGVWFSIVYLGEHYVIDVILGILYGIGFFILAKELHHNVKLHSKLRVVGKTVSKTKHLVPKRLAKLHIAVLKNKTRNSNRKDD